MANDTQRKTAKLRPRKHHAGPNGDAGGVVLKRDTTVNLGDDLPDPPSDVVLLEDDDWIEDDS
jgi:hypothetical protein